MLLNGDLTTEQEFRSKRQNLKLIDSRKRHVHVQIGHAEESLTTLLDEVGEEEPVGDTEPSQNGSGLANLPELARQLEEASRERIRLSDELEQLRKPIDDLALQIDELQDQVEVAEACVEVRRKRALRIIDPFMGSGTALVSAGFLGHSGLGIEINPFLHFAATAKCTRPLSLRVTADQTVDELLSRRPVETPSPLEEISTFTENVKLGKWIFNRSVLRGFTAVWRAINGHLSIAKPLKLALLSSLMECSNVRRDGKCVRYTKEWKTRGLTSRDLRAAFKSKASQVLADLRDDKFQPKELEFVRDDCREYLKHIESNSYDLFVTSPPYLNSFDYSDVYRPELFAGEFVRNNAELRKIRLRTLRSHVQVKREYSCSIASTLLHPILNALPEQLWSKDIPGMIRSYFSDMHLVLKELHRIVSRGGQGWLVVSTSAYAGIEVPVDLILADLAVQTGWDLTGVYVLRQLRAAGQHWAHLQPGAKPPLRESLIVLKKS
jgi:DNA modification methylase